MKFRKVLLLFMIVAFGLIVEGINVTRNVLNDESFEGFRGIQIDGFPFSRGARFRGPSYDFTESQTTDPAAITAIEISNEYGDVTVRRTLDPKAQVSIGLRKEVFTRRSESAESISDKVKLAVNREGALLKIGTTRDPGAEYRVKTHIEIETPTPLDTRITNRHGKIVVEGAKAVNVSGEFDDMRVVDVTGECIAKNRHGALEVISATLGCRVEVEYGDAHVEKLLAPSKVDVTHGNLSAIDLASLTANLKFSDLQARKIAGALTTSGEHSDLRIDDVKGDVVLNNQGDIDIQNVAGRINIDNQRGHVKLLKAAAGVLIKNTFEEVSVSDVAGLLEVTNEHGGIHAHGFLKGAKLETDSEDVKAADFSGPLNITVKRGDVRVKPVRSVLSPIDIQVDIGDVTLALPNSINALIDASVERGSVEGDVGALKSSEQGKRLLKATIGAGGPLLKLRSRLGDISVSGEDDLDTDEADLPDAPEIDQRFRPRPGADPLPAAPLPEIPEAPKMPKLPKAQKPADPAAPAPPPAPTPQDR
ncbi:MAG: DUF4097 domain-containing protein [Vicinamibacteria bacterium]|nr:DUF4097 domain-containing protein [Vicinamibacteria bacterium]